MNNRGVSLKGLSTFAIAVVISGSCLFHLCAFAQPTNVYSTGFEPPQFDTQFALVGQNEWIGTDSNGNGLVTNLFPGRGQQAYVGFFALTNSEGTLNVWRPLNTDPVAMGKPIVKFSVAMAIFDSTTNRYDCFRWSVYNTNNGGTRLFSLDFDNETTNINYLLDDGVFRSTQFVFENSFTPDDPRIYNLVVTMNFASNLWNATLNDVIIVDAQRITTKGSALNLGDIDAVWVIRTLGAPGDNYMVFDDYRVTLEPLAPIPFRLEPLGRLPNGSFSLRLTGEQGRNYAVEASTNLFNWASIRTNNATDGTFDFVDTAAPGFSRRFYRARLVP